MGGVESRSKALRPYVNIHPILWRKGGTVEHTCGVNCTMESREGVDVWKRRVKELLAPAPTLSPSRNNTRGRAIRPATPRSMPHDVSNDLFSCLLMRIYSPPSHFSP